MKDGIIKGTGNSRYLKSVADFASRYPDYASFVRALVAGTLPVDLNGINAAGWQQQGTALNKANLLTDATATSMGLTSAATPNDAFHKLLDRESMIDVKKCKVTIFDKSGSWTPPSNLNPDADAYAIVVGGGGAGGVAPYSASGAGGGGSGRVSAVKFTPVNGRSYTITVGAGGVVREASLAAGKGGSSAMTTVTSAEGGQGAGNGLSNNQDAGGNGEAGGGAGWNGNGGNGATYGGGGGASERSTTNTGGKGGTYGGGGGGPIRGAGGAYGGWGGGKSSSSASSDSSPTDGNRFDRNVAEYFPFVLIPKGSKAGRAVYKLTNDMPNYAGGGGYGGTGGDSSNGAGGGGGGFCGQGGHGGIFADGLGTGGGGGYGGRGGSGRKNRFGGGGGGFLSSPEDEDGDIRRGQGYGGGGGGGEDVDDATPGKRGCVIIIYQVT